MYNHNNYTYALTYTYKICVNPYDYFNTGKVYTQYTGDVDE